MKKKTGPNNAQDRYNEKRRLALLMIRRRTEESLFTLGERPTITGQVEGAQDATTWQEHLHTSRLMLRAVKQLDAQIGEDYVAVDNRAWKGMQLAFQKDNPTLAEDHYAFLLLGKNGKLADTCLLIKKSKAEVELSYFQTPSDSNEGIEPEWQTRPLQADDLPFIPGAITLEAPKVLKSRDRGPRMDGFGDEDDSKPELTKAEREALQATQAVAERVRKQIATDLTIKRINETRDVFGSGNAI